MSRLIFKILQTSKRELRQTNYRLKLYRVELNCEDESLGILSTLVNSLGVLKEVVREEAAL